MSQNFTSELSKHFEVMKSINAISLKKLLFLLIPSLMLTSTLPAQNAKETSQPLSKKATKGMLVGTGMTEDGKIKLTYKMKVNKKSDEVAYEDYVFDQSLGFLGIEPTKEEKTSHPDQKVKSVAAFVGGSNSFNVMSMTLNLKQEEWERVWDYDRQNYKWGKRLSSETVKPKNSESKYRGFASYANDEEGSLMVIASYDQKSDEDQFVVLYITNDATVKETKMPVTGNYSLVYSGVRANGNIFALLAPNKGEADTKKYVYAEFTNKGEIAGKMEFTSPSPNMIVMDHREVDGAMYFCGGSLKGSAAYNEEFASYAPIGNPGYSAAANRQMEKYEKRLYDAEFANFHLLKIEDGKLAFASSTPVSDFKNKTVAPPSQKKKHPYEGRKLAIENFAVTPAGDYLVTGQLEHKKIINKGNSYQYYYTDFVCLHFDKNGNLKAQYAVEKMNNDKESEMFQSMQNFFFSQDGKTAFWEILEVKGTKGYASFSDAYAGNRTYTANYFPRIATIDLSSPKVTDFTVLGEKGKFLMYRHHSFLTDEKNKVRYYMGHDDDYEQVWVGQYKFQ